MKYRNDFISATLAGALISIGGTVYLAADSPAIGSFLFALGLFAIVNYKLHLFTGRVGYLLQNKPRYLIDLGITWLGNLLGCVIVATLIKMTRAVKPVDTIVAAKLDDTPLSIFVLAMFCGMLMYIAVDLYAKKGNVAAVILPVMVFIIAGFEHCVANMFYFALAGAWSFHTLWYLILMTAGNAVGAIIVNRCTSLRI